MKRIINVFSPLIGGTTKVETEAKTWGELKVELIDKGIMNQNHTAFLREDKVSLNNRDDYPLPVAKGVDVNGNPNGTDCSIVLSVSKTEAGTDIETEEGEIPLLSVSRAELYSIFSDIKNNIRLCLLKKRNIPTNESCYRGVQLIPKRKLNSKWDSTRSILRTQYSEFSNLI